jgi:hypothetical protein
MGKRGRKRAKQAGASAELPPNFARAIERQMTVAQELSTGITPEAAIESRRQALRDLVGPADPVHLLGQLVHSEVPIDPETYQETAHEGLAYVAEMVVAEVLLRKPSPRSVDTTPAIDGNFLDEVRRLTQEAMGFEIFRRYHASGSFEGPEGQARGTTALPHLMLRGPGWSWQESELLRSLFGPEHLDATIRQELGFGVEDAIACCEAMNVLFNQRTHDHMQKARQAVDEFGPEHAAHRWASRQLQGWQQAPEDQQALMIVGVWALNTLGEAYVLTAAELAAAAEVSDDAAAAYLREMSQPMNQDEENWFRMAETVRERPWIDLGDGEYFLAVPGHDLWALRGVFERQLKSSTSCLRHRASWLESHSAQRLEDALVPDEVLKGVHFSFEDASGERIEGEIDALLRLGDTAIIVEAKSATMRPGARRGGEALLSHLDENLRKAIEQGTRALDALAGSASLTVDGQPVMLGAEIREVHPILVTLDDLSAIAPVLWQLQGTRYVPDETVAPWIVTLHELDLVCQTVEWPAQFVHFLRRRARLNTHKRYVAGDELDWWMHYLTAGLYFEDDTDEGRVRFTSLTDPLDAWVLHDRGLRSTPAPKPTMNLDSQTRTFLGVLCNERPNGWVAGACSFLEVNGDARKRFWDEIRRLRQRARKRRKVQRFTFGFSEIPQLICGVVVPDDDARNVAAHLERLVAERLEEHGTQRVLGIGTSPSSSRPYDALLVLDQTWRAT